MDDYFHSLFSSPASTTLATPLTSPIDELNSPPLYGTPITKPRHRPPVLPREDEGHEILPSYSASISLDAVLSKKMELVSCIHRAQDRDWTREYVSLHGTALSFYKCRSSVVGGVFSKLEKSSDISAGAKKGALIKTYNLQYAEAGIAADYTKRRYVIRVRAEADQFLLACSELETFVEWLQALFAAIDLAPPLEERSIPRDQSVPRARRDDEDDLSDLDVDDEEEDRNSLIRERATSPALSRAGSTASRERTRGNASPTPRAYAPVPVTSSQRSRRTPPRDISRIQMPNSYFERTQPQSVHVRRTNISPSSGKWHPIVRHSSTKYDMMYARRCFDILMENSPRKSNLLVIRETQWIVDWNTGQLTRWGPPEYSEAVKGYSTASTRTTGQQTNPSPVSRAKETSGSTSTTQMGRGYPPPTRDASTVVPPRVKELRPRLRAAR
ncbi:hypothetical protein F5884DRAFT_665741 [Xylogone sp. PMI_703]|nr:hypothetical protein F5884DRAFT_665741 [Xylogone sp. PMI_703]